MKISTRVTLTKQEVAEILRAHFESIGLKPESGIHFEIGSVCTGYGTMEQYSTEFSGVSFNTTIEK